MNAKTKKFATISLVILVSLIFTVFICNAFLPKLMFHGDYPYYPSVESITSAADVIIVGEVVTAKNVKNLMVDQTPNKADKETTPYTISTIRVVNVIKGNVKVGDIITIKQLGDYKNKPEETLYKMDGYLDKDTEHLMFLCEYESSPFSPVNPAQGIVEVKNGVLVSNNRYSLWGYTNGTERAKDSLNTVIESIKQFTK